MLEMKKNIMLIESTYYEIEVIRGIFSIAVETLTAS